MMKKWGDLTKRQTDARVTGNIKVKGKTWCDKAVHWKEPQDTTGKGKATYTSDIKAQNIMSKVQNQDKENQMYK